MPSGIFKRDKQTGIVMAWHGDTDVVETVTKENAFPWEMTRSPIFFFRKVQGQPPVRCKVPESSVFVASDDNGICGKPVPDTYAALTNSEFWEAGIDATKGTGAIVESAGTLFDRSRRFMTIRLPDDSTKIGDREFLHRISFVDSIDGSTKFYAVNTETCVVCANTARIIMGDNSGEFRFEIRHTSGDNGLRTKIENANKTIESMVGVKAIFNNALRIANEVEMKEPDAKNLFAGWIGENGNKLSTRSRNTVDRLVSLYKNGAGNRGETLLDVVSSVTDFYSHESRGEAKDSEGNADPVNTQAKQWLSSEYGSAMRKKVDFMNEVFLFPSRKESGKAPEVNFGRIKEFQEIGEKMLAMAN
jgi:hypothetical protein